jgi:hypothetical protein
MTSQRRYFGPVFGPGTARYNPHRSAVRRTVAAAAAVVGLVAGLATALGATPAAAANLSLATPQVMITASTNTIVGLQVFANVNLSGGANPTGTVTFRLFGPSDPNCTSAIFTSTVAAGTSVNSDHFTTSQSGTYRWEASYSGDANNNPTPATACTNPSAAVVVSPQSVALSVTAQPPSGGTVRASASLGGFNPTGTVTFYLAGPTDTFCSAASVFTTSVSVNGAGTYTSSPFTPTASGTYKWRAVYSGDQNNMGGTITACLDPNASVAVTVAAGAPVASLSTTSLAFGAQTVGTVGAAQTVSLSNTGTAALAVSSVTVSGANAADFQLTGNCAGITVLTGGSCTETVSYAPSVAGTSTANLVFSDNASPTTQSVALSGQGTAAPGKITYPVNGQAGVAPTQSVTWAAVPDAQEYAIFFGTGPGLYDIAYGFIPPTGTSYPLFAVRSGPVYVTLDTLTNGVWAVSDVVNFAAAGGNGALTITGSGSSRTFSWGANPGVQAYYFTVGTAPGAYDLANSGVLPATQTSYTANGLPAGTLFARLYIEWNGGWVTQDLPFRN